MATVRTVMEIITDALGLVAHYAAGEPIGADDAALALRRLQDMLAEWALEGITIPHVALQNFTLVASQTIYTVGENGSPTLNTVAPELVTQAFIRVSTADYPVRIITDKQYAILDDKASEGRPERVWINYTSPNVTFYMQPVPDSADEFYFQAVKPFTEPSQLTEQLLNTLGIPRGYHAPIVNNLALELASYFGKQIDQLVVLRANQGKNLVKGLNAMRRAQPAHFELPMSPGSSSGNIYTM